MTLKELRYVLAIQEHQNLSKAAQSLYLSQPALSKYIKNLEASLDVKNLKNVGKRLMLTAVHKNTVFKLGCGLFLDACREVARNYPDITLETVVVDTFAMKMLMKPQDYDVVVTTNMFGDIPSDEAAELVGGLGMAAGLCVGPDYCMAQATHGSAPDIAGKGIANPFAMIMSAQMMLSWLGEKNATRRPSRPRGKSRKQRRPCWTISPLSPPTWAALPGRRKWGGRSAACLLNPDGLFFPICRLPEKLNARPGRLLRPGPFCTRFSFCPASRGGPSRHRTRPDGICWYGQLPDLFWRLHLWLTIDS